MKADLAGANLNEAKMQGVNLLGADLAGTKLQRVQWGEKAVQEIQVGEAEKRGDHEEAVTKFEEAEEVYRALRQSYDGAGRSETAGRFSSPAR